MLDGLTFWPIPEFDDASIAFGADEKDYFSRENLPHVPKHYEVAVEKLFFNGGLLPRFQECVNHEKAMRAVKAWLRSFSPPHESKIATCAYAFWVWTEGDFK